MCTALCTLLAQWPVDRVGRPTKRVCSLEMSSRPIGRPTVHSRRAVDSPVDRWLQLSEKWPLAGRPAVDRQFWQNPNGSIFLKPIKRDFVNCFEVKIFETSWAVFPTHFRSFLHKFESKYFQSKGSFYQESVKVISCVFYQSFLSFIFSPHTWASHCLSSYRCVVVRVLFRWSSVVIIKEIFSLYLRRRASVLVVGGWSSVVNSWWFEVRPRQA